MALNSLKSLDRLQPEPPAPLKLRVFLGIAVLKLHFHGRDLIPRLILCQKKLDFSGAPWSRFGAISTQNSLMNPQIFILRTLLGFFFSPPLRTQGIPEFR